MGSRFYGGSSFLHAKREEDQRAFGTASEKVGLLDFPFQIEDVGGQPRTVLVVAVVSCLRPLGSSGLASLLLLDTVTRASTFVEILKI